MWSSLQQTALPTLKYMFAFRSYWGVYNQMSVCLSVCLFVFCKKPEHTWADFLTIYPGEFYLNLLLLFNPC